MRILNSIAAILSVIVLVSCSSREAKKHETQAEQYESLALQKYGKVADLIRNTSGTAVLCVKSSKPTQLQPQRQIAFFVYDIAARTVLFEDNLPNGSVSWMDDVSVVVNVFPGTVKDDDKTPAARQGYIFDLRSRKTRDLESVNVR
ncbi:MAG: hypothetical protein NTU47_14725 [Ignavibacteriales bacterium]|nr:hypothetical protein [Ignavibacteriales bacterium]